MTAFKEPFDAAMATISQAGSPFEIGRTSIDQVSYLSFLNAPTTLNELLAPGRDFSDQEFLIYQNERLSFKDFFGQADQLAHQLTNQFGISKGYRVAIAMRNYPEWLIAFVAIVSVGAVVVPLNSWGLDRELQQNVADAEVSLLICDQQRLGLIHPALPDLPAIVARPESDGLPENCFEFAEVIAAAKEKQGSQLLPDIAIDGGDPAMIMYTSGTSGKPKGALFSHRNCCQAIVNIEALGAATYLTNEEAFNRHAQQGLPARSLLTVPLFHVSGLYSQFLLNLRNGRSIVMMYKWDPATAAELIDREKISVVVGAPSMLLELVQCPEFDAIDSGNIINMSGGGAATPTRLSELIAEKVPNTLTGAGWGLTESGGAGTAFTGHFMARKPGSSGFVNPIVELRFCDDDGIEVPAGTPGEIWIKSPTVVRGYINAPEANEREFKQGWFKTGDIGYLDEDGCMVICDRAKDLVIRSGENIYPVEVENCILSMPGVERVAGFAVASDRHGEELAVVIKCQSAHKNEITEDMVQQHCREHLAGFKVPGFVKFAEQEFPVNATNKVIKKQVKAIYFP